MLEVTLFTKADCCLCDKAKEVIKAVQRHIAFTYREVDITANPSTYEEFREQIPVVFVNGRKAFKFHLSAEALTERLRREMSRQERRGD